MSLPSLFHKETEVERAPGGVITCLAPCPSCPGSSGEMGWQPEPQIQRSEGENETAGFSLVTVLLALRLCLGDPCTRLAQDADSVFRAGAGTRLQACPSSKSCCRMLGAATAPWVHLCPSQSSSDTNRHTKMAESAQPSPAAAGHGLLRYKPEDGPCLQMAWPWNKRRGL